MKLLRVLPALLFFSFAASAHAQNGCARLSWGTCDTWTANQCWQGPGLYSLVESVHGLSTPILGIDTEIRVRAGIVEPGGGYCTSTGVPDVWRFGDGECQSLDRIQLSREPVSPACPTLEGANPQIFTYVHSVYGPYDLFIRLSAQHDAVLPDPSTWYTAWRITFDFTHANAGPSPADQSTCGNADMPGDFIIDFANVLDSSQQVVALAHCDMLPPGNPYPASATWNTGLLVCGPNAPTRPLSDTCFPVAAQPSTWGRIKATYH